MAGTCIFGGLGIAKSFLDFTSGSYFSYIVAMEWTFCIWKSDFISFFLVLKGSPGAMETAYFIGFSTWALPLMWHWTFCNNGWSFALYLPFAFYISCNVKLVKFNTYNFQKNMTFLLILVLQTSIWYYNLISRDVDRVFWTIVFMDSACNFQMIRQREFCSFFSATKVKSASLDEINVDWRHGGMR